MEFIKRRVCYWILQWVRLVSALVGIITLGLVDGLALRAEAWYLDLNTNFNGN